MNNFPNSPQSSDSEILLESFSDEETENATRNDKKQAEQSPTSNKDETENCDNSNAESDSNLHQDAAEIRKLLRRKDELERKQKMQEKYNERLQVGLLNFFND